MLSICNTYFIPVGLDDTIRVHARGAIIVASTILCITSLPLRTLISPIPGTFPTPILFPKEDEKTLSLSLSSHVSIVQHLDTSVTISLLNRHDYITNKK